MGRRIYIFDTTLRDGEQVPGAKLNRHQKIKIARQLVKLRVNVIEAGFPYSSPDDFGAVMAIAKEVGNLEKAPIIAGLARCVEDDIKTAWDAVKYARFPRVHIFIGASDIHIESKHRSDRESIKEKVRAAVTFTKSLFKKEGKNVDIEFSCEDATRADFDYICCLSKIAIKTGATVINIPDTVGYGESEEFGQVIAEFRRKVPEINSLTLSVHCHNDLGLAVANTMAAIKNGADQVECTINGIGERAGNAALEEIVANLRVRRDRYGCDCDIDTTQIYPASRLVSRLMNIRVQRNKAIVGKNAFAHSSGIHQDGVLKNPATYEIMKREDYGIPSDLEDSELTARSGRAAIKNRLVKIGYILDNDELARVAKRFKIVADRKKKISDDDLRSIVEIELAAVPETFEFVKYQITSGTKLEPMAMVILKKGDQLVTDLGTGNGPVDAVINAIERITETQGNLLSYDLSGVTKGHDALGEATSSVEIGNIIYSGIGTSPDVIEASARAYLNAFNRYFANGGSKPKIE